MQDEFNNYSNRDILNLFYIHGESLQIIDRTCRLFNERYPHLPAMNKTKLKRIESSFIRFGIQVKKTVPKPITGDDGNEIVVLGYFHAHPTSSIPAASADVGISCTSIHRVLKKNKMHPYSFQTVQAFRPGDQDRRIQFCEFIITKTQEDPDFLTKIIWTDESKFNREGIVNRRNCHHWAQQNPHAIREANFQDTFSFNVFAMIINNRVEYEIYNENLTSVRYLQLLREVVLQFLNNLPHNLIRQCWFQMDGAPAHSSHEVYRELTNIFEDRWIGRNGPSLWPPRSPDLTPLDFYLWGQIKNEVYASPVQNKEQLIARVRDGFRNLNAEQVRKATTTELRRRIMICLERNGDHFEHL